jgi:fructose-bisphosphate aldolase / 6-deoxy-5-ketofructose 1-phosphate synthase
MYVPLTVPKSKKKTFEDNYNKITHNTGKLLLFAGDQRVEHLNGDFFGPHIAKEDADPEHLFRIAAKAKIGCFASQLGYIARYGMSYPKIPYLVKINSKTHLVKTTQADPHSFAWYSVSQVVDFQKQSGLNICGVGYTVYLGSEFESQMLHEAAQIILEAHKNGLVTVLWMYPRGKAILDEKDAQLTAGAVNVASALGADFAKVNFPTSLHDPYDAFKDVITAAGRMQVVCAGGSTVGEDMFLESLYKQINQCGASGCATGRNVHQRSFDDAVCFVRAMHAIVVEGKTVSEARKLLKQK